MFEKMKSKYASFKQAKEEKEQKEFQEMLDECWQMIEEKKRELEAKENKS